MSLYYRKSNTEARDFSRVRLHYSYDEILGEHTIRFIGKNYISNMEENDFHDKFQFLGKNINISELVNITKN